MLRPEAIPVWLNKPVPSLEHDKPIELIARGEYRRVATCSPGSNRQPSADSPVTLDVKPVAVTGIWSRHVPAGGDHAHRSDRPASGRWQRGDVVAAGYLASDADTCWARVVSPLVGGRNRAA
jgi:hypothetical protein